MNLTGFRPVFAKAVDIQFATVLTVEVAPPAVIAVLKVVAYVDRLMEIERDLGDLSYLIKEFVSPTAEEGYSEQPSKMGLALEEVSAHLLGRRLAKIMNKEEKRLVGRCCSMLEDANDPYHTQAKMANPWPWCGDPADLLSRITALKIGLESRQHN